MDASLIIPAFIAGLLTFLAPCTFPLVPGYLGFISGLSPEDLQDESKSSVVHKKVFFNGLLYVIGFSTVFVVLGSLLGLGGAAFIQYRLWFARIGGVFVIIFGLYMMHVLKLPFLNFLDREKKVGCMSKIKPGKPLSSFLFGATFAFGWTPCVGPILGTILLLASMTGNVPQGAFLLFVFSLGLAVPFLLVAVGVGSTFKYIKGIGKYLNIISFIGGIFLVVIGVLLMTNNFGLWISYFYRIFNFFNYEAILDYL